MTIVHAEDGGEVHGTVDNEGILHLGCKICGESWYGKLDRASAADPATRAMLAQAISEHRSVWDTLDLDVDRVVAQLEG